MKRWRMRNETNSGHRRSGLSRLPSLRQTLGGGNEVICLDNLFTGSKNNIRQLPANPYFEFIWHDVTEPIQKVIRLTGSKSRIVHEPLPSDDSAQRRPVIDLAREKLGWQPTIDLEEGLVWTIAYFREIL